VALDFGARAQDFLKRITPLSADLAAGCDEYPAVRPVAISLLGNCGDKFLEGEKQRKSFDDRSPSAKLIDATDGQDYLVRGAVKGIELCVRLWQGIRSTDCRG
jgi:hypothetical protein